MRDRLIEWMMRAARCLPAELAHDNVLDALRYGYRVLPRTNYRFPVRCMGMEFVNPLGLAAGLDKNALALPAWERLGFGFVEIGAVTPLAQPGNPKPRIFRLKQNQALINRMGFNNDGMARIRSRLIDFRRLPNPRGMRVGVNLGKNKNTPLDEAGSDYLTLMEAFWHSADYLCLNISSPNTPALRELSKPIHLKPLLGAVCQKARRLHRNSGKRTPLVIKVDPDHTTEQLQSFAATIKHYPIAAVIATNSTRSRPRSLIEEEHDREEGGLSGAPLTPLSLASLKLLRAELADSDIALIGCGGIDSPEKARAFFQSGAQLVQIYTGLIYQGPHLIESILKESTHPRPSSTP